MGGGGGGGWDRQVHISEVGGGGRGAWEEEERFKSPDTLDGGECEKDTWRSDGRTE